MGKLTPILLSIVLGYLQIYQRRQFPLDAHVKRVDLLRLLQLELGEDVAVDMAPHEFVVDPVGHLAVGLLVLVGEQVVADQPLRSDALKRQRRRPVNLNSFLL